MGKHARTRSRYWTAERKTCGLHSCSSVTLVGKMMMMMDMVMMKMMVMMMMVRAALLLLCHLGGKDGERKSFLSRFDTFVDVV